MVKGQASCVRNIFLHDNTDDIEEALWRHVTTTTAKLGDWVEITNVVDNDSNAFHPNPFVASTQKTTLTVSS